MQMTVGASIVSRLRDVIHWCHPKSPRPSFHPFYASKTSEGDGWVHITLKMTGPPSFTQLSDLRYQKSALDRNEGFPSGPVGLFQGHCTHHTPSPCAHVSLSSPHLYHPKQGECLHQEAGKPKSSYIHDIFHVTLENHMTSLFCL